MSAYDDSNAFSSSHPNTTNIVGLKKSCTSGITSNLDFREWSDAFPNRLLGAATLDRWRHNAYRLILEGQSYRAPKPLPDEAYTGVETPGKPPAKGKVVKS